MHQFFEVVLNTKYSRLLVAAILFATQACEPTYYGKIMGVRGVIEPEFSGKWLTHEHLLVDFIGADSTGTHRWDNHEVSTLLAPQLLKIESLGILTFVDATPNYLGRDPELLVNLSEISRIRILTNTGLYGAVDHKYLPDYAFEETAEQLADRWISEMENGIGNTGVRPGFIKISVNPKVPLHPLDKKLVIAAALTHQETGLTIASHTGPWEVAEAQLNLLDSMGVDPSAFIWVHAQQEADNAHYLEAATRGAWISLDGVGWEYEKHFDKIRYAYRQDILSNILISHDGGWYDPIDPSRKFQPYTTIVKEFIPDLQNIGFTDEEIYQLMHKNPVEAYTIRKRLTRK